jgi:protein-S-isoprenylcysteine O-methyltransferase Ste14
VSLTPVFKIGLWNAWIFMSVFLLQMLAIMFIAKRVRERSHVPGKARRNKFERYVSIFGNLFWLLAMGYSVFLPFQLGTLWFYIGLFVFIIGLILMAIATFNFIATPADQLITKGAYSFSRHPMYLATFFICIGSGIATVSLLFIILSIIMALCFYQEALIEERFCLNRYGNTYKDYINSTPRWIGIPRPSPGKGL